MHAYMDIMKLRASIYYSSSSYYCAESSFQIFQIHANRSGHGSRVWVQIGLGMAVVQKPAKPSLCSDRRLAHVRVVYTLRCDLDVEYIPGRSTEANIQLGSLTVKQYPAQLTNSIIMAIYCQYKKLSVDRKIPSSTVQTAFLCHPQ